MTKDPPKIDSPRREIYILRILIICSLVALIVASFALISIVTSPGVSCASPPKVALLWAPQTCTLEPSVRLRDES